METCSIIDHSELGRATYFLLFPQLLANFTGLFLLVVLFLLIL